jgi:flavorubredoxin
MADERPTAHPIADETFVIADSLRMEDPPFTFQLNSMVILGEQPVLVDTGAPVRSGPHLEQIFGLVDPGDVRWVFLSHEDADHAGNLAAVMEACPGATLATNPLALVHLVAHGLQLTPDRVLPVGDGDFIDIGDRLLVVQRPPLYDSPSTHGVFDTLTEVFWGSDCFSALLPTPALETADIAPEEWRRGFVEFHQWNSPWLEGLDARWWDRIVDRLESRRPRIIASAHGPTLRGDATGPAIDLLRELPQLPVQRRPEHVALDRLLRDAQAPAR